MLFGILGPRFLVLSAEAPYLRATDRQAPFSTLISLLLDHLAISCPGDFSWIISSLSRSKSGGAWVSIRRRPLCSRIDNEGNTCILSPRPTNPTPAA
ncbi:hypothetical protein BS47DRAFT_1054043 [Hydnum rufescens UP504]|uniref:Uncharacterized protein n=1 Tax=Hydnum rufescens UP504 TaxID=1448309 RepID=A0A9P6AV55_9AGAM|nr:hypothetical protein BS47DRAFT_1054043 [Hydnum rufescens UP504]